MLTDLKKKCNKGRDLIKQEFKFDGFKKINKKNFYCLFEKSFNPYISQSDKINIKI